MAEMQIVYWRDIPSQVIVRAGRRNRLSRLLGDRFQQAIDAAAMQGEAARSDTYLEEWRKSDPVTVGEDLAAEADAALVRIEEQWDRDRLRAIVQSGGWEKEKAP